MFATNTHRQSHFLGCGTVGNRRRQDRASRSSRRPRSRAHCTVPQRPSGANFRYVRAAYLGIGKPTISRQLATLERLGLIERSRDAEDARAHVIRLTPAGAAQVEQVRAARRAHVHEMLSRWIDDDVELLAASLRPPARTAGPRRPAPWRRSRRQPGRRTAVGARRAARHRRHPRRPQLAPRSTSAARGDGTSATAP
ncbi:MarR family winged helix-turn-helix transcriptional regulator [Quadrisphaera sp. INWT6]|uniref:MarR family winged helix-turn-helix transcriptional regulator n=1 Tax=Quadrisphaera sp. INWT6 TaxID=2596917 RepID=UPI0035CD238F